MRTTISMDDQLAKQVRREAAARSVSVSAFIAALVDDALKRPRPAPDPGSFRLITFLGEGPVPGVDLDRPRELDAAEDAVRYGGAED